MELPATFAPYRNRRLWCCYPMIWDEKKHHGFGGYGKPPINPHNGFMASTDDPETLGTYEEAVARVGQYINYNGQPLEIKGVGISLTLSGLVALDLDSVARLTPETPGEQGRATPEAVAILRHFNSYTEISPSGDGLHIFMAATLPADLLRKKTKNRRDIRGGHAAEYELMSSGYMTISGNVAGKYDTIRDCTAELEEFCRKFLADDPAEADGQPAADPAKKKPPRKTEPPKGQGLYTWERWQEEVERLTDPELMERIYKTPRVGQKVRDLYEGGDISNYNNDHSYADLTLCGYLWGFTHDRGRTERLFRASALYRAKGKSRNYIPWLLKRAEADGWQFIGAIEPTPEERKAYAQAKEAEEKARFDGVARKYADAWRRSSGSGHQGGTN